MDNNFQTRLLALCTCVCLDCLTVGITLGTIPAYVHGTLGCSNLVVGLTIGLLSATTVASRHFSGTFCDTRGSRKAVVYGSLITASAGLAYIAGAIGQNLAAFLAGRVLQGLGESLFVTGALAWGVGMAGPQRTGKVMAWVGIAMYAAMAVGAPLGNALAHIGGTHSPVWAFALVALAPLLGLVCITKLPVIKPTGGARLPFYRVMGIVGRPGVGLALATVGFCCLASFAGLYFTGRGWPGASLALTVFGGGYILVRLFGAHWPDRFGGRGVALASLTVEVAGQLCLWRAPSAMVALIGAGLTGLGFSLVFPSFGVEAVKHVDPQNRGVALGGYVVFFDLSLGVTAPLAGWVAGTSGYAPVFALGAAGATLSALLALTLRGKRH